MPDYILKLQKQTSNQILKYLVHVFYQMFNMCVFKYAFARLIRVHLKVSVSI